MKVTVLRGGLIMIRKDKGIKQRINIMIDPENLALLNEYALPNRSAWINTMIGDQLGTREKLWNQYMIELKKLQEKFESINYSFDIDASQKDEKIEIKIKKKSPKNKIMRSDEVDIE